MGALVVSYAAVPSRAQNSHGGQWAYVDPGKVDSWISINGDGTITALTGKCDLGQGMTTAQTQLIAEELCVPMHVVKLVQCDTAVTPDQGSTAGSQSTPTNFNIEDLALAGATAREALVAMAAARFGEAPSSLTVRDGVISSVNGKRVAYVDLIGSERFNLRVNRRAKRRSPKEWV